MEVADLSATLAPPSLPSHRHLFVAVAAAHGNRRHALPPSDVVACLEGTVDVPRRHHDVMLSRLVVVVFLWLATWRHSVVFVVAGVVGMCCGGCEWSNEGCARWWLLVAMMMQHRWSRERMALFGDDVHVCSWQMPLTRLSKREGCCLCNILT
jgi:hypothetical protein